MSYMLRLAILPNKKVKQPIRKSQSLVGIINAALNIII